MRFLSYSVKTKCDRQTDRDRQTDGRGRFNISRRGPSERRGDNKQLGYMILHKINLIGSCIYLFVTNTEDKSALLQAIKTMGG